MKTNVFILICLLISSIVFGQDKKEYTPVKFLGVENGVYLNADNSELIKNYLVENVVYPEKAIQCCKEGTEVVKFTITPKGEIANIRIDNCVCCEIDNEVIRVLGETNGKWIPAYKDGSPVQTDQELAMVFCDKSKSQITEHFVARATVFFNEGNKKFFEKQNPEKALKLYNRGLVYLPYDKGLLFMRGVSNYELGNEEAARKDWEKVASLGGIEYNDFDLTGTKSYNVIKEVFAEN